MNPEKFQNLFDSNEKIQIVKTLV